MKIVVMLLLFGVANAANAPITTSDQLRAMADGNTFWAEFYSYGPVDRAYFLGRAEGLRMAADIIEGR